MSAVGDDGLFPEQAEFYGVNVRTKLERCVAVADAQLEAAARRRAEFRERAAEAISGVDLLVTPTLAFVAPPAVQDDLPIREAVIRFTFPFNALGRRWRCRAARPTMGCPHRRSWSGGPARTPVCWRPGPCSSGRWSPWPRAHANDLEERHTERCHVGGERPDDRGLHRRVQPA